MRLLSVDWDTFFPDSAPYDWGHNETGMIFYEIIWGLRAGNRSMATKERALDAYVPDRTMLNGFWQKVLAGKPTLAFASDSHLDAYRVAKEVGWRGMEVYNFDAHHDCGYPGNDGRQAHCGNWLKKLGKRVTRAVQCYPAWRKEAPEGEPKGLQFPREVAYWPLPGPVEFDAVFVCRSSPWTPSWSDHLWLSFLDELKDVAGHVASAPYVEKARPFEPVAMPELDPVKGWQVGAARSSAFA
jgi:hypothetical protein